LNGSELNVNANAIRKEGQVSSLPFAFVATAWAVRLAAFLLPVMGLALWVSVSYAQAPEGSYDEAEAQAIDRMLMCPVCPAESIDQAQVPLARQMKQRVRELLAEGATRQEVLEYFAERYGQDVLASPPKSGVNLLAWGLPIAGLLAALAAVLLVLRSMRGRGDEQPDDTSEYSAEDGGLAPYLAEVDRSLALDERGDDENGAEGGKTNR
jgi:cytochrome c-type biogenesis protein CcmH